MDKNFLDGKKLRILKEFVGNNNGLTLLSMNQCRLGEEGAFFIAVGLAKNKKLRTLILSGNNIKDAGLNAFSDNLARSGYSLAHLDLSNNTISDDGATRFARSLTSNRSLQSLNFKGNQIGRDGGMALRESVGQHPYLLKLYLESNAVQVRDIEEIDRILRRNRDEKTK